MKKIVFLALSVLALVACSSDSKVSEPEPLTIQWSLSGTLGGSVLDSLRSDMNLTGNVNRSASTTLHLNGYDTTYFENKIVVEHVMNGIKREAEIDEAGNFTFRNADAIVLQGRNDVRFTPRAKGNVNLSPWSVTVRAMVY